MVGSATHQMIAVRTGRVNRRGLRICAFLGYRGGQGEEHQEETDEKPLPEHFSIVSATDGRYGMVVWYGTVPYGMVSYHNHPQPTHSCHRCRHQSLTSSSASKACRRGSLSKCLRCLQKTEQRRMWQTRPHNLPEDCTADSGQSELRK